MLARFLEVAAEGLVAVLGNNGFLADIGQSLEMTRVALYTIQLLLPLHLMIIMIIIIAYRNIFYPTIQGQTVEGTNRIKIYSFIPYYHGIHVFNFLYAREQFWAYLQMEKLLFCSYSLYLSFLIPTSIFIFHQSTMNRVSPLLNIADQPSLHALKRSEEPKSNQLEVIDQFLGPRACRICLDEEPQTPPQSMESNEHRETEMIIPCECRGSVGFVHQKCIKMWIQKQLEATHTKRSFCQICKTQIFYKKTKVRYCECSMRNLCETSPCNIVCLVAEIVLIGILALVEYYIDHMMNFPLLKNTLLALLGVVCLTFFLTLLLIVKDMFIRTAKQIQRIYSLTESQLLGLRETKAKTMTSILQGKKRKIEIMKREIHRPMHSFGSISPEAMIVVS